MQGSKIRLSPAEAALIGNAEVILTKNSILQKTVALLAGVQEQLAAEGQPFGFLSTPKISKGENYRGLPYVVLDYPRMAEGENMCFIRTMFWWGHFFSSTLQVAGQFKTDHLSTLAAAYPALAPQDYFIGISQDPWQHHFEATNYQKLTSLTEAAYTDLLQQLPHIKIAARWSLTEWDAAANLLTNSWRRLAGLIA